MERPILLDLPDEIPGERITLRPLRDSDADAVFAAIQESIEHIRPWLPWYDEHKTIDDTVAFIRRTQSTRALREEFDFGIFAGNGHFLGGAGMKPRDWTIPSFEIGYWIRASEEGNGYITEAAELLTRFAFDQLKAERVMIGCDTRNSRSRRVPERLGYRLEGIMRRSYLDTAGKPADTAFYAMIRSEFDEKRL